ncbi:phage tail family protein [Companilactobacillus allii]|uniref:Siphovirus-type tail component RIFT-related domain-containing protein n=1 Tax=Companilactobacillus allii TaxID=1847728 RepID=A0A1P8Q4T4_9LACO|nr:phage tail domain-containing protein [Companilactobacillus allii]APX72857.1 hypothetical protein BTM29_09980 [Companilactobacillus allii]USQ67646.1 phage tail family protein [Companilactobacillus allii]
MRTLVIQRLDGTTYDLDALGIKVIEFSPPSPNYTNATVQVGRYGERVVGTSVGQRQIPISMDVFASNDLTIVMKRNKFFQIFDSIEEFYVIDMRLPMIRWKVRAEQQPFKFYENWHMGGDVSFNLICSDGYSETVDSTLNIDDLSKWAIGGMNIPLNLSVKYKFNEAEFDVFNASNIDILAEEKPYRIIYKGAANFLTISNETTNQTFKINRNFSSTNSFELYGAWPFLDGESVYADGNHELIDLKKGWNHFKIGGCQGNFEVAIDTRFYY